MRFVRVVKLKGGLQRVGGPDGEFRSRRVLTPEESALFGGKKALTKKTYTTDESEAKRICEGHLREFEDKIAAARGDHLTPLERFERKYGDPSRHRIEEIADFCAEEGFGDPFHAEPKPKPEPVTFDVLLATWELENTNERTRRTKRRYMARFAEHLGHDEATRVEPPDFAAFKETLLKQANAGEIAHKSAENHIAGVKAVFNAAVKAHKIAKNPCDGISFQAKKSQMVKTLGYSIVQVAVILREGRNQPSHIRYPTLIAGFSGARVGEIADATTHDVYMVGDMYVLDIRTDYREEGQEIKNEVSIRNSRYIRRSSPKGLSGIGGRYPPARYSRPFHSAMTTGAVMPRAARSRSGFVTISALKTRRRSSATSRTTHSAIMSRRNGVMPRSRKRPTMRSPVMAAARTSRATTANTS